MAWVQRLAEPGGLRLSAVYVSARSLLAAPSHRAGLPSESLGWSSWYLARQRPTYADAKGTGDATEPGRGELTLTLPFCEPQAGGALNSEKD